MTQHSALYHQAAAIVHRGGIIAYPTEAVWGLGCDPWNIQAISRVLTIKGRPEHKGLVIIAADAAQIQPLLKRLPLSLQKQIQTPTTRATTWLLPDTHQWLPSQIKGQHDTVAVRISHYAPVQHLCHVVGHPLVSTSANITGAPPMTQLEHVHHFFKHQLDMIVPGQTGGENTPSTIIDAMTLKVIR